MSLLQPPLPVRAGLRRYWKTPHGAALALALVGAAREHEGLLVVLTRDSQQAAALERELAVFAGDLPVLPFPDWETLPYDLYSPHPEIISQRVATLYRLADVRRGILVVPVATAMQRLAPHSHIASGLDLRVGQRLDLAAEQRRLEAAGYRNVPQVGEPGEFAVRGALIDIFPMGAPQPYRIELFDQDVDTIRGFDPETQRSAGKVDAVHLLPAREFPLSDEAANGFRNRLRERFPIDLRRCPLYQDMKRGVTPGGIEYYLPLFFEHTETLFDYLGDGVLLVLAERALTAADAFWTQAGQRFEQRAHDIERPILPPEDLYLPPDRLRQHVKSRRLVEVVAEHIHAADLGSREAPILALNPRGAQPALALHGFLDDFRGHVLIAADSAGRREALAEQLSAAGITTQHGDWPAFATMAATAGGGEPPRPVLAVAPLERGFTLTKPALAVLTEHELLGERVRRTQRRRRGATQDPEAIIRDLGELDDGAPIVHVDHGVGRYRGLSTIDVGGTPAEFLDIEYAKQARLYVPVAQLALVSRYTASSPELAPLHSLGGDAWERAKRKAAQKVRDVAAELLAIHAQRAARQGHALSVDQPMLEAFAAGFPFEETPDQLAAIDAVLADIKSPKPMDRVVCGDVGFGKTEVALRAAFAVASAGKQVAVLVPTTLLAQQHYQNFADRFADWPLRIEVLSRFKSKKDMAEVLDKLASGRVDVVVGTHRLLQKDVKFKDLGLVIVDEEQRFGVRHKERLKLWRAEVDMLTLTATPIPRTLNMAMSGMRDLSIIATPPAHRVAVKTLIAQYDPALVREAFQRELQRGGQIYFLHNQVDSIERTADDLGKLIPEARIRIGHGQMPERELEQVMLDFHRQRFNVLVCTTIIESGIDIPTANTIIINRADRFGLAQLHQLRGRVGRSHHRAYAFLIVPERKAMSSDAHKRLQALAALDELGAGFTLATHDMEIRGAGELLGEEQSGQIQEVGFGLYTELLARAVKALQNGTLPDFDLSNDHQAEVELHAPALIPADYLADVHTRLTLYKRIAAAADDGALRELQVEMIDRFGLLPEAAKNLFAVTALRLRATALGIRKLDLGAEHGRIRFSEHPAVEPATIIGLMQGQPRVYQLDGQDKLRIHMDLPQPADRLRAADALLTALAST